MKICFLCYRANPFSGGQGIYLRYVAEELVRQGHEVHAVIGPPYRLEMKGVTAHTVPNNEYYTKKGSSVVNTRKPFDIFHPVNLYEWFDSRLGAFPEISSFGYRAFFLLRKLHEKFQFDIIHDNQSLNYGVLFMTAMGIPVVATIHHPLTIDLRAALERAVPFTDKFRAAMFYPTLMQSFVSKRLDHIITVSENSRLMNHRDFGIPLSKQTVIYNGIDRNIFRPLKVRKNSRDIVFVGNTGDPNKGFLYLLRAMKLLKTDTRLIVADGGHSGKKTISAMIHSLGLENRVVFTGSLSHAEIVRLYSSCAAAVVPSIHEGFGFPAAEAMSCGVPVIATDAGALPEVVGDAGMIVPARNIAALADGIDTLLGNKKMRKTLSRAGIGRVENMFSWERAVKKMTEVYSKLKPGHVNK